MKEFIISNNDSDQRIDKFLQKAMPELPKNLMYRLIRKKDVKINGKKCEISDKLSKNDVVRVYVKDELSTVKKHNMSFLSASRDLNVIYEDSNIIIVFKPIGIDSHSNDKNSSDTLIDRIKLYLYNKGEYTPETENSFAPALCSRLDRNTSGIVTASKNASALRELNNGIRLGYVHKIYQCITIGRPQKSKDVITAFHYREPGRNIVRISSKPKAGYKEIRTGYKILAEKNDLCLLEVHLYTGRTHQIRAHLAHIGCPILGDGKYGNISENKKHGIFHQKLCAYKIEFDFPDNSPLYYLNDVHPVCSGLTF